MIYSSAKSCRAIFFQVFEFNKLYFLCICLSCSGLSFSSDCTSLAKLKFGNISIASASVDAIDAELPVFCKIKGVVQPNIGFEARLPMKNWNGKFFQVGCGGFCGLIEPDRATQSNAINHALAKGMLLLLPMVAIKASILVTQNGQEIIKRQRKYLPTS